MKVGILGAGQLGRMLALAGYPLGLDFLFLDPSPDACAAPLAPLLRADYADESALADFCRQIDVATFEFENVPLATAEFVAARVPLRPYPSALLTGQDRVSEKALFERLGIEVAPYAAVDSLADLEAAVGRIGLPLVVKTRRMGYDGKGQARLRTPADVSEAWATLGGQPLIAEAFVAFEREVSCIGVRGMGGETAFYPLVTNVHRNGILHCSRPADDDPLRESATECVRRVMEALDYVGVLAFEFFVAEGRLLGNEIAPRVHNSGHWTIEGSHVSQFENHLRAICGLPLGSTASRGAALMVNFIGTPPAREGLLAQSQLHVHLYGKAPKPQRKVGHATLVARDATEIDRLRSSIFN